MTSENNSNIDSYDLFLSSRGTKNCRITIQMKCAITTKIEQIFRWSYKIVLLKYTPFARAFSMGTNHEHVSYKKTFATVYDVTNTDKGLKG